MEWLSANDESISKQVGSTSGYAVYDEPIGKVDKFRGVLRDVGH